ncbi:dihydroorotase [Sandaracinus amylolyticus]|uniref:dihydroorotase n=1 Tax=Sandaracinus amylolyticus TaxID=927083 RepID=UPI003AF39BE0|nr:Dihydroorotase [Sandaracinus amylolyticus]
MTSPSERESGKADVIVLAGGRVIDPSTGHDGEADVVLEGGKVTRVGRDAGRGIEGAAVQRIEARGRWVVPGFIDLHVHFREPGQEYKEDIASGLRAAAAGGFTAVCAMPNTKPVNDTRAITEQMVARAKEAGGPRLFPFGAITMGSKGEQLTEMADMKDAGAVGVSDDGVCVMNAAVMRRALEYAATFDLLVSQHCEDHHLTAGAQMHEGAISTKLGLRGWPREAEDVIVARDLVLNQRAKARYHVAHVSTKGAVALIREAKARGQRVSCEVTPHHLLLTDHELLGYRTACKVNPPLREAEDVEAMVEALRDGTIDCVATDHAPHSSLEKDCELAAASPGMIGLETTIPLLLGLVHRGALSATRFVEALTSGPARLSGIRGGSLRVGERADVTVIDPETRWTVGRETLRSKSLNSPWLGKELRGACAMTIAAGEVVFER